MLEILSMPGLRILTVVRDHMSGLLYSVPYLRALSQNLPQARIDLLANPYASSILDGCPYVNRIIPFFQFRQESEENGQLEGFLHPLNAWKQLVGRVDLVIHFRHVGPKTLLFCATLGRPFQVGYAQGKYDNFLDINLGLEDLEKDSRARNSIIIEALGLPKPSPEMEMWIPTADSDWANSFLRSNGWDRKKPLIVFHPGCHWGCNEWLIERWPRLGEKLQDFTGGQIVITGDKREKTLAARIANDMKTKPIIAAGNTTLPQLAAIIDQASLVISVDTVPTQICQALKKPAVIMMGAGNPKWNGPIPGEPMLFLQNWDPAEEGTLPCDFSNGTCHGSKCRSRLAGLSLDYIFEAAVLMLENPVTEFRIGDRSVEGLKTI